MKTNKITPLDELRQEKEILKAECAEREERLGEYWEYINDNAGSLILDGIVYTFKKKLGIIPSKSASRKNYSDENLPAESANDSTGFMHTIKNGLMMTYPLIWEIAQPMIWEYALKKIKSIFTRKKKKKKNRRCEEED